VLRAAACRGHESFHNGGGGGSVENRARVSAYDREKRALAKALATDATQSISITLSSRLIKD